VNHQQESLAPPPALQEWPGRWDLGAQGHRSRGQLRLSRPRDGASLRRPLYQPEVEHRLWYDNRVPNYADRHGALFMPAVDRRAPAAHVAGDLVPAPKDLAVGECGVTREGLRSQAGLAATARDGLAALRLLLHRSVRQCLDAEGDESMSVGSGSMG
jgi:hypothetical protein